ncbi:hypothetical protein D3879_22475 [Pseudomonas cavernicola]|uniref:Uncharacterized protein n=1 Tax=Pseudomonas cavernicola TaxID=2320866 RepID=A0A418X838_9PSED|nr:hypothetical protein [Pseudomonas cavernicola]RJG08662.1 hypothetical protein D3879_22475 [Pseudomonas cavernicola]
MAGIVKALGVSVLAGLAIPAGGLSGLEAVGSLLPMLSANNRTSGVVMFFLCSAGLFGLAFWFLVKFQKQAKALVESINRESDLRLDSANLLGYPAPIFLIFDKQNRKLAICNHVTGDCRVYDFAYVLAWRCEWREVERVEISGAGSQVSNIGIRAPTFERVKEAKHFTLVLEVADEHNPILKLPISERAAKTWCARLNALFIA